MNRDVCCNMTTWEKNTLKRIEEQVEDLCAQGGKVQYHKGHVIFYEGHIPYGIYLLKSGKIQLTRTNMEGRKENLSEAETTLLGLFHLITNTPHCATAQAKTDVEVLFIPKSAVLESLSHR